ncbi:MAG: alpha/beta hydrolase, partial [Gemmatimonadetes bacterium]|nr:alpha/beta hydrolase [Gemmatimonadota bacterium]
VRGFVPDEGEVPDVFGPLMTAFGTGDADAIADALVATPTFSVEPAWSASIERIVRDNVRLFGVDPTWAAPPDPAPLDALHAVGVPTRVVVGAADFPAVLRLARELAAGLADARLVEVPDGPHLLPLTHPQALADAVHSLTTAR